jgi:cytidyltransferase-like protein
MDAPGTRSPWGCVVGRFQPFHNDHLSLVEEAYRFHGRVIVAVTNADPTWRVSVPQAPRRHLPQANPFSFWQRCELIAAALANIVPSHALRIIPFPIHDASLWDHYLPGDGEDIVCWVRDRGPWEERKIADLGARFVVRTLPAVVAEVSGSQVRELLADGDPRWRDLVPPPVAALLDRWRLPCSLPTDELATTQNANR